MVKLDINPPINRTMRELDRSLFRLTIPILAAEIEARKTGELLRSPALRGSILDIPKITNVVKGQDGNDSKRLLLLGAGQLSAVARQYLDEEAAKFVPHNINLDYEYWTADQILRSVLPPELGDGSPTAFSINGHIAHMNLRDEYLPYRYLIGQVILDKNKIIRTVVNKLDSIETEFRFFKMEVLAGEPDFIIKHNESNCTFTLDFSTVYWNSRLAHEHERLVNLFATNPENPAPVIADVFAGVGPFAVPAAKRGAVVYANDLNGESTKWMEVNVKNNKVVPRVRITTLDGRKFIHDVIQTAWNSPFGPEAYVKPLTVRERRMKQRAAPNSEQTVAQPTPGPKSQSTCVPIPDLPSTHDPRRVDHFVMNLPGTALEFLDAFKPSFAALLSSQKSEEAREVYKMMPMVHVHCFTRELEEEGARKDILDRAQGALGSAITNEVLLHHVRKVAPNKEMYCLSFRLPQSFLDL
ncbi:tRNA(m(1)G37)methyltransferase [Ceratobasidium sp. 414]|nr:tRNA(m(1)G37)methyltransferase [Ceratobasidium sp. 414]